jgi:riboflavin synthase
MFTGLIDDVGRLDAIRQSANGRELRIRCPYDRRSEGESVAVNGACLTVLTHGNGWFTVGAISTTLGRTTIGGWEVGRRVNLERALRLGDRLGGHLVQGHVDGVATVRAVRQRDDARVIDLALPLDLVDLMVQHGSIAVDGVSLTVNDLPSPGIVQLSLIDHTMRHTTLGELEIGHSVHVEADMMGKYAQRLLAPYLGGDRRGTKGTS